MKIEDIITKLKNPDTLAEGLIDLNDFAKSMDEKITSLNGEITDRDNTITTLRDTNQRLYLRVTADQPENETDDRSEFEKLFD